MKKNRLKKILIIGCIIILFGTSIVPLVSSSIQKKLNNQPLITKEESVKINVFDCSSSTPTKTTHTLSILQTQHIIKAFLEIEMTEESFYQQATEKLKLLQENRLISPETLDTLTNRFRIRHHFLQRRNTWCQAGPFFDVVNIFDIIIFGLKGVKDQGILEIDFPEFPFLNGTIAGRFALLGKYTGMGSVFSLGILGFRYCYEFDKIKYPEFPHFPEISGTNLGFIGILIQINAERTELQEKYYIGAGTTMVTMWNIIEE